MVFFTELFATLRLVHMFKSEFFLINFFSVRVNVFDIENALNSFLRSNLRLFSFFRDKKKTFLENLFLSALMESGFTKALPNQARLAWLDQNYLVGLIIYFHCVLIDSGVYK